MGVVETLEGDIVCARGDSCPVAQNIYMSVLCPYIISDCLMIYVAFAGVIFIYFSYFASFDCSVVVLKMSSTENCPDLQKKSTSLFD